MYDTDSPTVELSVTVARDFSWTVKVPVKFHFVVSLARH